jgi:hypothetical protein
MLRMPDTYARALALIGVTVPAHLAADAEVPVLSGPQAQGDLLVVPAAPPLDGLVWTDVPASGVQVVHGEATGNTHWLHRGFGAAGVRWARAAPSDDGLVVGYLSVPEGASALLIHTDEHGANGIGPGRFAVRRKREADEADLRYVED